MIESPLLSAVLTRDPFTRGPMLAMPKIDGWRVFMRDGAPRTRTGHEIANEFVRHWLSAHCPDGFDGELQVGADHDSTASALRRVAGRPDFRFHVFDYVFDETDRAYSQRLADRDRLISSSPAIARRVKFVPARELRSMADLLVFEQWCLAEGFEGVVLRRPDGGYKSGRSTENEGLLIKVKRSDDGREMAWERIRQQLCLL